MIKRCKVPKTRISLCNKHSTRTSKDLAKKARPFLYGKSLRLSLFACYVIILDTCEYIFGENGMKSERPIEEVTRSESVLL